MKRIVVSLLLALCLVHVKALPDPSDIEFRKNMSMFIIRESKCLEKESITEEEVNAISLDHNLDLAAIKPQFKCFNACVFEYIRIMENCKIHEENFGGDESLKDLHRTLVTCKGAEKAGERCECAIQLWKCMNERGNH